MDSSYEHGGGDRRDRRDQRAPIEKLPIELIQKIFLECLDINFPRASPAIASALSDEVIYTWLIRLAFSSNNDSSKMGFFTNTFLPLDYFAINADQRATLQTDILQCRWCTLSVMRKCQREYVEQVIRQMCSNLIMSADDLRRLEDMDDLWESMGRFSRPPQGRRGKGDLVVAAKDPRTNNHLKISIWFNDGAVQIREPSPVFYEIDVFSLPCCSFTEPCRMPDKLLQPPWTEEKLEFLTLLSTEAYIDEDHSFQRSKAVLRQLIMDRDVKTFERLLSMQIRVRHYGYPLRWPIKPNHFRMAARYAESEDDPFLKILFTRRRSDVPKEDTSIQALMMKYDQRNGK